MTAGTISSTGNLCSTALYVNAADHDGSLGCAQSGANNDVHGPSWSATNNSGCPLDDPGQTGNLGPDKWNASVESLSAPGAAGPQANGFGWALGLNTGTPGLGQNYMDVYVRSIDADGDGFFSYEDCDDNDPTIYPQAGDTYGDGIDSDCDGLDCEAASDGNTYFVVCPSAMNQAAAQSYCQSAGYDGLTTLLDAGEQAFFQALSASVSATTSSGWREIWLGLNDLAVEGSYIWVSGLAFSYSNWVSSNPGPQPSIEDCVMAAEYSSYEWHDVNCGSTGYWPSCELR